jgi:hypothetical protein
VCCGVAYSPPVKLPKKKREGGSAGGQPEMWMLTTISTSLKMQI